MMTTWEPEKKYKYHCSCGFKSNDYTSWWCPKCGKDNRDQVDVPKTRVPSIHECDMSGTRPENSWEEEFDTRFVMNGKLWKPSGVGFEAFVGLIKAFIAKEIQAAEARGRTQNLTWQKVFEQIAEIEKRAMLRQRNYDQKLIDEAEARGRAAMLKEVSGISGAYKPGFEAGAADMVGKVRSAIEAAMSSPYDPTSEKTIGYRDAQKDILNVLLPHLQTISDKPIEGEEGETLFFNNIRNAAKNIRDWRKDEGGKSE